MLRFGLARGRATGMNVTNIQNCVNNNIHATLFRSCHCVYQLAFSPPASRDSALLVKLSEIPLKVVNA